MPYGSSQVIQQAGLEDSHISIKRCAHRRIDEGLAGQSFPGKVYVGPTHAIVEGAGVVELDRPMRAFKVKSPRSMGDES